MKNNNNDIPTWQTRNNVPKLPDNYDKPEWCDQTNLCKFAMKHQQIISNNYKNCCDIKDQKECDNNTDYCTWKMKEGRSEKSCAYTPTKVFDKIMKL
jgi:hypothetical protein